MVAEMTIFYGFFFTSYTSVKGTVVSAHGPTRVDCFRVRQHTHAHVAKGNQALQTD